MSTSTASPAPSLGKYRNIKDFKAWFAPIRSEVEKLVALRAFAEVERKRVASYALPLLATFKMKDEDGFEVTSTDSLYALDEESEAKLDDFYAQLADLHVANGWTGNREFCPALVARNAAMDQEHVLLPHLDVLFGVPKGRVNEMNLNFREKAIGLLISALKF